MKKNQKIALEVGAGVAAIAAAAAGVYFMTGKNAKNRKKVAKWASDFKEDVVLDLNKAGKVTKQTYQKIIDTTAKNYSGLKNVSTMELAALAADLKGSWDSISGELANASSKVRSVVPKVAKAATKSAPKKTATKVAKAPAKKTAPKKTATKRRR